MDNLAYEAAVNSHEQRAQILSEIGQLEFEIKGLKLASNIKISIAATGFEQVDSVIPPRIGYNGQEEATTQQLLKISKDETAHWGVIYIENLITARQKQIIELKNNFLQIK